MMTRCLMCGGAGTGVGVALGPGRSEPPVWDPPPEQAVWASAKSRDTTRRRVIVETEYRPENGPSPRFRQTKRSQRHMRSNDAAGELRGLHAGERVLILPNVWDAASAALFAAAGARAVATTSAGL